MVWSWFQKLFWNQGCDAILNLAVEFSIWNFYIFQSTLLCNSKHLKCQKFPSFPRSPTSVFGVFITEQLWSFPNCTAVPDSLQWVLLRCCQNVEPRMIYFVILTCIDVKYTPISISVIIIVPLSLNSIVWNHLGAISNFGQSSSYQAIIKWLQDKYFWCSKNQNR